MVFEGKEKVKSTELFTIKNFFKEYEPKKYLFIYFFGFT